MPALTRLQVEHARKRVETICQQKIAAEVQKAFPSSDDEDDEWTTAEQIKMILAGEAVLDPEKVRKNRYGEAVDMFIYPAHPNKEKAKARRAAIAEIRMFYEKRAENLIDLIIMSPNGLEMMSRIDDAFNE